MSGEEARAARVAGELTKAQRRVLCGPMRDIANPPVWFLTNTTKSDTPTLAVLTRRGLIEHGRFGPTMLTPLGLAIRKHLENER